MFLAGILKTLIIQHIHKSRFASSAADAAFIFICGLPVSISLISKRWAKVGLFRRNSNPRILGSTPLPRKVKRSRVAFYFTLHQGNHNMLYSIPLINNYLSIYPLINQTWLWNFPLHEQIKHIQHHKQNITKNNRKQRWLPAFKETNQNTQEVKMNAI